MSSASNIIKTKFRDFCSHCSLNGLYYFSSRRPWPVYVVWGCVVAASAVLCGFLGHMIWANFVDDPTFTVVETTHYSIAQLEFPAVTICDEELVYGPATENITEILESRGFNNSHIGAFYKSFTDIKKNYNPEPYVRKMHSVLRELGYTFEDLVRMVHKPCSVLVSACGWRSQRQNCSHLFREILTHYGHCCEFTIDYFKENAPEETSFVSGTEHAEALETSLDSKKYSFDGEATEGYVLMFIYDPKHSLSLMESAITLTPAGYFDVSINPWVIDSSEDVKRLALRSRKCLVPTDNMATGEYYQECMSRLILRRAATTCRCLPFRYTAKQLNVEEYPPCSWERLICIYQTIGKVRANIREILSESECYQRCDYVQYDTKITYSKFDRDLPEFNKNLVHSGVHFTSTTCIKYRREVLYTWDQMLANLGGIFGLCLGGSIISVIEVVWFILDLLLTLLRNKFTRSRRVTSKQASFTDNEKDFTRKENYSFKNKNNYRRKY